MSGVRFYPWQGLSTCTIKVDTRPPSRVIFIPFPAAAGAYGRFPVMTAAPPEPPKPGRSQDTATFSQDTATFSAVAAPEG